MTHVFFMRHESCRVYMIVHLPSIMTSILMQLVIEKNEGAHSHTFKLAYYNFPMLIMRGGCEVEDGSCSHCLL